MQKLMKAMHKSEKGFTLVELMVVVVIIAVLVAIAIPIYQGIQRTAAESAHDANVRTLKGSGAIWYAQNGTSTTVTLMENGGYLLGFEDHIEGSPPQVPQLLRGAEELNATEYTVTVDADGNVDVVPGFIGPGSGS